MKGHIMGHYGLSVVSWAPMTILTLSTWTTPPTMASWSADIYKHVTESENSVRLHHWLQESPRGLEAKGEVA